MDVAARLRRKLRWSLEQRGVWGTLRAGVRRLLRGRRVAVPQHPFDREFGVDTSGMIGGGDLAVGHSHDAHITAYVGMAPSRFIRTTERWRATPGVGPVESYSFVDLGCGKGRALLLASRLPFREAVGVELNPELARTAEANARTWTEAGRAVSKLRVVCGDATEFAMPEGPCLVYLANPFGAAVLQRLLDLLVARAQGGGGVLELLYQNPAQEHVFAQRPEFVQLWSEVIPMSEEDAAIDPVFTQGDRCVAYRIGA